MPKNMPKAAYTISTIVVVLSTVASAGGLFIEGLYRDNTLVTAALQGNDLVTLVLAVPILIGALLHSRRTSQKAQLIWMAMLGYMLYNYAFYLFGASFNEFFLIYAALFALPIYGLIIGLMNMDIRGISEQFSPGTPVKWISSYMLIFAVLLGGMWAVRSFEFVITMQVPQDVLNTGHTTAMVYALDLTLLVPALILGAVLLWRREPWGYALASIVNVKAAAYAFALIAMSIFADRAGVPGAWDLTPLFGLLGVGALIASRLLIGNMCSSNKQGQ